MSDQQNANQRFNQMWDEIGAKQITLGDEENGVQISVDADFSIFAILDKLKEKSKASEQSGKLTKEDVKSVGKTADAIKKVLGGGLWDRLDDHF